MNLFVPNKGKCRAIANDSNKTTRAVIVLLGGKFGKVDLCLSYARSSMDGATSCFEPCSLPQIFASFGQFI